MSSVSARGVLALLVPCALVLAGCGDDDESAETATVKSQTVSFLTPTDGAKVSGPTTFTMSAEGITIEAAGEVHPGAGHFHVIADQGCLAAGTAVPRDADHVHLGGGQSDGRIFLEPGAHDLCLQAGDGAHLALAPTDTVKVEVGITDRAGWCATVGEIDTMFEAADTGGEAYAMRKVAYENIRRLFAQLAGGIDQVDAESRDDVRTTLDFGTTLSTTFAEAADEAAAVAALKDVYGAEGVQSDGLGATWILDNCQVDIDG